VHGRNFHDGSGEKTDRVVGLFLVRADFSDAEIILRHAAYLRVKEDQATRALKR